MTYIPSITTPGVVSDHTLMFRTTGRVPSGGHVTVEFKGTEHWDMPTKPNVVFVGAESFAVNTSMYEDNLLTITTAAAVIPSQTQVELIVADARSAADTQQASTVTVRTRSQAGLIDRSDVDTPGVGVGELVGTLTYMPDVATPGVQSKHDVWPLWSWRFSSAHAKTKPHRRIIPAMS